MLSPVNNAGLNTCQWGSHGWARGEEGEWGDPADAVEKGELTPVKWLIKVRWLPFWGADAGQDSERNSKPHLANWALCRPQAADRKPQIQEILLLDVFTQTEHTACMKCWWQMLLFSYPKTKHAEFILSYSWMMSGFELCIHPLRPQIQCIQTHVWLLLPFYIDKWSALCEACYNHWGYWWFPCSRACKGVAGTDVTSTLPRSACPSYPSLSPLLHVKQSIFHL